MTLTEKTVPAYYTAAFDLDGSLKIQQLQNRRVLFDGAKPVQELELLPIELAFVANPTKQDTIPLDAKKVLGTVGEGAAKRAAALEVNAEKLVADLEKAEARIKAANAKLAEWAPVLQEETPEF